MLRNPQIQRNIRDRLLQSVLFVVVFVTVGETILTAIIQAGGIVLLLGLLDSVEAFVGDYAANVVLGVSILGFFTYIGLTGGGSWVVGGGLVLGSWFVFDGVQHLRYNIERDGRVRGTPATSDDGLVRSLVRIFIGRLLEPFRLQ